MKFILLELANAKGKIHINPMQIVSLETAANNTNAKTKILTSNMQDGTFYVVEAPNKILEMIES